MDSKAEMKSPIEILLDKVEYKPVDDIPKESELPYVTHEGILKLGALSIKVCVLNTGERVIEESEMMKIFNAFN